MVFEFDMISSFVMKSKFVVDLGSMYDRISLVEFM